MNYGLPSAPQKTEENPLSINDVTDAALIEEKEETEQSEMIFEDVLESDR